MFTISKHLSGALSRAEIHPDTLSREGVPELLRGAWISSAARYRVLKCEHSLTRPSKLLVLAAKYC